MTTNCAPIADRILVAKAMAVTTLRTKEPSLALYSAIELVGSDIDDFQTTRSCVPGEQQVAQMLTPPVLAELLEQLWRERPIAVFLAFALADHHMPLVDVGGFECERLAQAQTRANALKTTYVEIAAR